MIDAPLSRRQVLSILGVAAAAPLVGSCQRGDSGEESTGMLHLISPFDAPPKGHFNLLGGISGQISLNYAFDLLMIPGGMYLWDSQTYVYFLADDSSALSSDGTRFTYRVRDGLTWSDGSPITGKDVYSTWSLRWANGHEVFDYVEDFRQVDDMTVEFRIPTPAPVTEYYLLRERMVADSQFAQWAERADRERQAGTARDDDAVAKISEDVAAFRPDRALVSGVFDFEYGNISNATLYLKKNEKGYAAKKVNFERAKIYTGNVDNMLPVLLEGKMDYSEYFWAPASEPAITDAGYRILRTPCYGGPALFFNFGAHPEFKDKRVRQALAHAIDRTINGTVSFGKSGIPPELMCGLADNSAKTWLAPADLDRLDHYELDRDKATQLLTDAGWSKDGDRWLRPDGSAASYDILVQSNYIDWSSSGKNVADQLGEFGIPLTIRSNEATQVGDFTRRGKFDLVIQGWGSGGNPYPTAFFRGPLIDTNRVALDPDPGIDFDLNQETDIVGPIDLEQAIIDAGQGENEDALKANVTRMALAFNELLPVIPLVERYANSPINPGQTAGWPDDDDPIYQNSPYADNYAIMLVYDGTLRPA